MKLTSENSFELKRGEVKVFSVDCITEKDSSVFATVSGFADAACISTEGRDYLGKKFTKNVPTKAGVPTKLWCYVKLSEDETRECVSGELCVRSEDGESASLEISAKLIPGELGAEQFNDIASLRRLYWLNSDLGIDETVPKPFTPVSLSERTLKILGREIRFGELGLPAEVSTFFTQGVTLCDSRTEILRKPLSFEIPGETFAETGFSASAADDAASIIAKAESERFTLSVSARAEFDGYVDYKMTLTAKADTKISDASLRLSLSDYAKKYFMGLGRDGGYFSGELDWKWDTDFQQDCFWIGNVNAGVRLQFKGENYVKPLVNIYYKYKKLMMPESWGNGGRGGIRYDGEDFIAYSGERELSAGESVHFDFNMIVTPMKPIDVKKHFNMRIFHKPPEAKIDLADAKTANIVNVHHGNDLNPYINYPFFENEALGKLIEDAHARDMLVKVYYTIRELTIHMPEFSALRDLGDEVFERPGELVNGSSLWQSENLKWIRENVGEDFIPAWRQRLSGIKYKDCYDSSVITNGQSRLCNFYVEGLKNLVDYLGINGIYVDDVAYDRNTMKRVRKVLDTKEGSLIDFHTWNHHVKLAGYSNCFNLYMELLPYIDKMWVGEGFDDYTQPIDYWLVEISGIPFGLMSELMLRGNPHRGLLFGMTNRLYWRPNSDPTNMWELFDKYGLDGAEIIGPWDERNNVSTSNPNCYATIYKVGERRFIALGNWTASEVKTSVSLRGEEGYTLNVPYVRDFQPELGKITGEISIPAAEGFFIEVLD